MLGLDKNSLIGWVRGEERDLPGLASIDFKLIMNLFLDGRSN